MKISIITTLYKSAVYIPEFIERIVNQAELLTDDYELIMVDDGSPDNSLAVALEYKAKFPKIKLIEFSRNFGHHKAMMTGLDHAVGDFIFLIDSDLEEDPELLGVFYEKMKSEDWDVVYGYQQFRRGGIVKRNLGALGWKFIQWTVPIKIPNNQCTVRLMRKDYVRSLCLHKEYKTAIGGLWVLTGYRQTGIIIDKKERGISAYTFSHRLNVFFESLTSYSDAPLYIILYLGLFIFITACGISLWLVYRKLSGAVLEGWISIMISVWMLGGLILFCIGLLGLYIARIFIETKNRPYTIIRKIYE